MKKLRINSDNAFAEISIFDYRLQQIAKGLGYLAVELPRGVYKIQVNAGNKTYKQLVDFNESKEIRVTSEQIGFGNSTIPIGKSEQAIAIAKVATAISQSATKKASLFVFISSYFPYNKSIEMYNDLELYESKGTRLISMRDIFDAYGPVEKKCWCNGRLAELDGGNYRLRIKINEQVIEQSIYLSDGVQTQVFFAMTDKHLIDIQSMSIAQVSYLESKKFDPQQRDMHYEACELAKNLLCHPDLTMASWHAEQMAYGKYLNPFLGIYSAHILIKQQEVEQRIEFIAKIFRNTYKLLGPHPDLMVVGFWLMEHDRKPAEIDFSNFRFENPPMLRTSWEILVELSKKNRSLFSIDSLLALSSNYLVNNGPWYTWLYNEEIKNYDDVEIVNNVYTEQTEEFLPKLYAKLIETEDLRSLITRSNFSLLETRIINLMDDELPIRFLVRLSDFINRNYKRWDESEESADEEISRLLKFMTAEIRDLLEKTLPFFADPGKKEMVKMILDEFGHQKSGALRAEFFEKNSLPENYSGMTLSKSYYNKQSFSKALATQLHSSDNSISIALNGIGRKLKL